jgi:hypothetical protein
MQAKHPPVLRAALAFAIEVFKNYIAVIWQVNRLLQGD